MKNRIIIAFFLIAVILITTFYIKNTNKPKIILIGNKEYLNNIVYLDLSENDLNNDKTWMEKLKEFNKLQKVNLNNQIINNNQKEYLTSTYPNITFILDVYYKIYNKEYNENIEILDLSNETIDENLISLLKPFKNLKEIDFKNNKLNIETMAKLVKEYPNINFKWKIIFNNKEIPNNIEKLDFTKKTNLNIYDIHNLLTVLTNLKEVDFSDSNLKNEDLALLRKEFPNINIIWKLYLGKWSLKTNDVAFSVLVGKINYTRLTTKDIEVLKYCTNLKALDLGHQAIDDISVIGNYLQDLRILILADNKVKDLTPLKKLKHLHYLELFVNNINDFSPLTSLKELVDINIGYNDASNIEPLLHLGNIERFWLVNGKITEQDRITLKNAYPNAIVNTAWSLSSTEKGWRTHPRYYAMIDMFYKKNYISEEFTKYDK